MAPTEPVPLDGVGEPEDAFQSARRTTAPPNAETRPTKRRTRPAKGGSGSGAVSSEGVLGGDGHAEVHDGSTWKDEHRPGGVVDQAHRGGTHPDPPGLGLGA